METMTPKHGRWSEFYCALSDAVTAHGCQHTTERSRGILGVIGFNSDEIQASLTGLADRGGYCDCEILMNCASGAIESEEQVPDSEDVRLAIYLNNAAFNSPCPLCGERTDPGIPLAIFIRNTYRDVCERCAAQHAPDLLRAMNLFYQWQAETWPLWQEIDNPLMANEAQERRRGLDYDVSRYTEALRQRDFVAMANLAGQLIYGQRARHYDPEFPLELEHFGVCPKCLRTDGYLNVGRDHWFVCDEHKARWCAGSNLFSSWKEESEEVWRDHWNKLKDYEDVKTIHFLPKGLSMADSGQNNSLIPEMVAKI